MKTLGKTGRKLAFIFTGFVVAVLIFIWLTAEETAEPLPNPNGYYTFVLAGKLLKSAPPDNLRNVTVEELKTFVAQNGDAFQLAVSALTQQCRVPVEYSEDFIHTNIPDSMAIRKMAQSMNAKGNLAERDGRLSEAATNYLEAIRLGQEVVRGGLLIHFGIGTACEMQGASALQKIVSRLESQQCRELFQCLQKAEDKREPFRNIDRQERIWGRKQIKDWRSLVACVREMIEAKSIDPWADATKLGEKRLQEQHYETSHLLVTLAARIYELEKGKKPSRIDDLVPVYLKKIPVDPITGTNFVFDLQTAP